MNTSHKAFAAAFGILVMAGAFLVYEKTRPNNDSPIPQPNNEAHTTTLPPVAQPMDLTSIRVTKKSFGTFVTPQNSPVQPERFRGYHTATDFETFPDEANSDLPVYAICSGKILQKRTATGYGGVLVQSCTINNQSVTVVYGHIKLSSIAKLVGDSFTQGEKIGYLGQPPAETGGERKHLHLGIHKGTTVDIRGYVNAESDLAGWLDFQKL